MPLPWSGAEYTIWGKVVASPESGPWWVLWIWGCPRLVLAPKTLQPCANQLVCWFCAGLLEWMNCLSLFLVPSRSSSTPLYPSKVLRARNMPQAPNLSVISILGLNLSLPKGLGVRQFLCFPFVFFLFAFNIFALQSLAISTVWFFTCFSCLFFILSLTSFSWCPIVALFCRLSSKTFFCSIVLCVISNIFSS